ncbi:hypothetical protein SISSUDRAFT_1055239 [Sistotremastrum suecicum HHB10207 ss-3]|uniref:Uncharacterized protein n=1 Tax=Sistotremastrum suecicum HHB10207 ss-3 TaxID=1314776 RepID=A0A165XXR5_9AGAM|nr:hypothetical protein SISSUDRAFT_1055239 [Sistotremastrum suecicum HHB10207 ss-3]
MRGRSPVVIHTTPTKYRFTPEPLKERKEENSRLRRGNVAPTQLSSPGMVDQAPFYDHHSAARLREDH